MAVDYAALTDSVKRLPIVEIYNQYIGGKLRHIGRKAVASCPWHGRDSSPSLTLYTDAGNWYCYGCQCGGTNIDLVMRTLSVDFRAAVDAIARDFGLSAERPDPAARRKLRQAKTNYAVQSAFDADYDRIYFALIAMRDSVQSQLKDYEDYLYNPDMVNDLPMIEGMLDMMLASRSQEEKLAAWRYVRGVFPWLKKLV